MAPLLGGDTARGVPRTPPAPPGPTRPAGLGLLASVLQLAPMNPCCGERPNDLVDGDAAPIMNPAEVALAELEVLLDEAAVAPPAAPAAIACPTRRRIGNPTNESPARLPEAAAAALKRRREQQPEGPRTRKRVRGAPAPVAEFAAGAEVEALWEGKWYPGVVAEVVV